MLNRKPSVMQIARLFFFAIFLVYSVPSSGQVRLEDCQRLARENYPMIRQYELIELTREYTMSNANKNYLPRLDVTLIGGMISGLPSFSAPGEGSSSSSDMQLISVVQLNQPIWDGGVTKAKKGVIEANTAVEKAELEISLYALEERINNLFFGILLIDEQIGQLEILRSSMQINLDRVNVAVENGTAYKSDIDEIQVEMINIDQRMEELRSNRNAYINVLGAMTGRKIEVSSSLERPVVEDNFLQLENNRPELRRFQSQGAMIEAQRQIDRSALYPKIGLLGFATLIEPGIDFGASTIDNIFVGGLSLNWNLDGLYRNGNNKKLTELNLQKVAIQKETFLFNNELELTQTRLDLNKFRNLVEQDREILELKTRIKEAYELKYENGVSTMSELLKRTHDESAARQNLVIHEIQYLMTAYRYKNRTGN
jgi:outer membrane protein TolC